MDKDMNKLKLLSFFEICTESLRISFSWRKYGVFKSPLFYVCCLSLSISYFILLIYNLRADFEYFSKATIWYLLKRSSFNYLQCFIIFPVFSLFSLSSVVYAVAGIFSGKEEIMYPNNFGRVVKLVSKRVLTTFMWSFAIIGSYAILAGLLVFFWFLFDRFRPVVAVVSLLYLMGFAYIFSISHLAHVVSILEDVHGLEAFVKSKYLIKGKVGLASAIFMVGFTSATITVVFLNFIMNFAVNGEFDSMLYHLAASFLLMVLGIVISAMPILFLLTSLTMVYFVCKSNREEETEKSRLADHLVSFIDGGYVPVTGKAGESQDKEDQNHSSGDIGKP